MKSKNADGRLSVKLKRVYRVLEREEGTDAYKVRSVLARAISFHNPVANDKYVGRIVNVQILKAVRRG